jgi:hypothetical protein
MIIMHRFLTVSYLLWSQLELIWFCYRTGNISDLLILFMALRLSHPCMATSGSAVVKHRATRQNATSSRRDEAIFFLMYLILAAALGSWVHSASDRNEYQKQRNNVYGE